jgi:hypothetical protein
MRSFLEQASPNGVNGTFSFGGSLSSSMVNKTSDETCQITLVVINHINVYSIKLFSYKL